MLTGCVAGKLETDTDGVPVMLTEPDTGWVAGKFETVTEPVMVKLESVASATDRDDAASLAPNVAGSCAAVTARLEFPTVTVPEMGCVAGKLDTDTDGVPVIPTLPEMG